MQMIGMTETMLTASKSFRQTILAIVFLLHLFQIIDTFKFAVFPCDFGGKLYFKFPNFILHLFFLQMNMNVFLKTIELDRNVHPPPPAHRFTNEQLLGFAYLFSIAVEQVQYKTVAMKHCIATGARINDD
jgi:hypothetical protein